MLAQIWGLKNQIIFGNIERAARWFAVAARYSEEGGTP
jgi:hypothetical protein